MSRPSSSSLRDVLSEPAVVVVIGAVFVIMLGFGLIVPVLPLYARSFGVGKAEVGLLMTSFAVMRLVFDLVAGPMVERWGERLTASAGAAIVGVSAGLSAIAPNFPMLVVFRSIGGAGSSIMFAAALNHLIHTVPANRMARTMSLYYSAFLLGTLLGQPIGGVIAEVFGLASPLVFYAGACVVSTVLIFRYFTDRPGRTRGYAPATREEVLAETETPLRAAWGRVRGLLSGRAFLIALAANAVGFWALGAVRLTLVPLFAKEEVGLSESGIGAVLGVAALAQFAVMWKAGSLADSLGRRPLLAPALAAMGLGIGAVGWATQTPLLLAALVAVGLATAFVGVVPAAVVADVAPRSVSATAVGVYRFAGDVGFVLGPLVGGLVADVAGFRPAFVVIAVPLLAASLLALGMPETLARSGRRTSARSGAPAGA
ncbi:MAG: MFS transporter [Actinomycetota bacterium]